MYYLANQGILTPTAIYLLFSEVSQSDRINHVAPTLKPSGA